MKKTLALTLSLAATFVAHGIPINSNMYPFYVNDSKDRGCIKRLANAKKPCKVCKTVGMPDWSVSEPYINLWVSDTPASYMTSLGTEIAFQVGYDQRDTRTNYNVNAYVSNGEAYYPTTGWNHNWWSYIHVTGANVSVLCTIDNLGTVWETSQDFSTWSAAVYTSGGGVVNYSYNQNVNAGDGTQLLPMDGQDSHIVVNTGSTHSHTRPNFPFVVNGCLYGTLGTPIYGTVGLRRVYADGSQDIYGKPSLFYYNGTDTGPITSSTVPPAVDFLLTERIDAYGNSTHLYYTNYFDGISVYTYCYALQYVVDPDGKTNTFTYTNDLLTGVALANGTSVAMHYNGYGQMDTITDAASMTSSFTYDPYTGYMTQMQTPYGYTTFAHTDLGNMENGIDVGNAGGTNRVSRACLVTLPDNSHELYAFRFDSSTVGIPDNYSAQAPSGTPLGTLDTGGTSDPNNSPSYLRNSFYWDRKQAALLSSLTPANLVAADYLVANRSHWLVAADGTTNHLSESISTYQEASPDGSNPGHIMWYDYAGKGGTSPWLEGGISQQSGVVAQMLPDGTTQYSYTQYNPLGLPCIETSTYTLANGSVGTRQISKDYTNAVYSEWIVHTTQGYNIGYNYWTNNTLLSVLGPENDILLTIGTLTNKAVITTQVDGYGDTWTTTNMYPIYAQQVFTDVSNNVTRLFYNTRGQISGSKLPTGLTHTNLYAANGFIQKSIDSEIARTNTYAFTNALLAAHTNELGLVTTLTWDALQRLTSIKYPDATTISNVYTYLDLTNQKDRMGNWAHAIYDNMRQMTNCTDRLGHTTTLTYCNCGSLDSVTDPLLNTTSYVRDNNGRLLSEDFGGVPFRQYTLDSIGRVSTVTETSGASVTYSYNNQGNVVQATGQYGTLFQTRYNIENDPDVVINADGTAVTNTYDRLHRVITSSTTNGVSRNNYTGVLLASAVDALNRTNWFTYDAAGHVTWTTNANSEKQNYTYNAAGNTISFTDAKTQKTSWGYDVYGRAITETNAANVVVRTNGYDANNRLTACWSKARGQTVISFDACDNATNIAYPTLSPVKLTYDALNRPATMSNEVGVTTFGYVPFGAFKGVLNSEAGPFSTVSYGYVNNLLSTLTASSWSQSFTYDLQNRLQGITSPAGSFNLGYNGPSQEIAAIAGPGHTSAQTFDAVGNIKSTTLKDQFNNILDSYSYDYDSVGNRTNATRVDGSYVHYNYDKIGQLYKSVGFEQNGTPRLNEAFMYSYDKAGNLNSRSNFTLVLAFNVNNLNALTNVTRVRTPMYLGDPNGYTLIAAGHLSAPANSVTVNGQTADLYKDQTFAAIVPIVDGANSFTNTAVDKLGRPSTVIITRTLPLSISFTNDDNGNLLSDGVRSFVYDDANRLREVYVTNSWRSVYICDGLSRRSKRMDYNWQASAWNITNETHYVYAGPQVIQELNASNIPVVSYTIGAGLLARTDANGSLYYHVDGNNNVTMLVNGQGTVMASYTYDPYGNIISRSGPMADANLYRFASQEINPTAGIYAYLFRFYDPNLQRWLTKDPIGLRGGRNVFAFVGNNPISRVDPFGLAPQLTGVSFNVGGGGASSQYTSQYCGQDYGIGLHGPLIPYSFSGGPMFNATSEAGFLAGYGATFSAGGGFFHDPFDDASFGGFMSAGAFVGPPNDFGPVDSLTTSKSPKCNPPFVMGSAHGLSSGLWVSNAGSPKQLGGPFDQVNYNLIIASLSVAYSGDTWIAGLTFGPKTVLGPVSVGLSMSSYPTTTFSAGGVNLSGRPILYVPNE